MLTSDQRHLILTGKAKATPLKQLGLRSRGEVFILDSSCVRLIDRSSRFLRKDAESFLNILSVASASVGRNLVGHIMVRRAPICSKARQWLDTQGVTIESIPQSSDQ